MGGVGGGRISGSVRSLSSMRLMTDKEGQQATGQIISGKGGLSRTCPLLDLTAVKAVQRHNRGLHTSLLDLTAARAVQRHSRGLHTSAIAPGRPEFLAVKYSDQMLWSPSDLLHRRVVI